MPKFQLLALLLPILTACTSLPGRFPLEEGQTWGVEAGVSLTWISDLPFGDKEPGPPEEEDSPPGDSNRNRLQPEVHLGIQTRLRDGWEAGMVVNPSRLWWPDNQDSLVPALFEPWAAYQFRDQDPRMRWIFSLPVSPGSSIPLDLRSSFLAGWKLGQGEAWVLAGASGAYWGTGLFWVLKSMSENFPQNLPTGPTVGLLTLPFHFDYQAGYRHTAWDLQPWIELTGHHLIFSPRLRAGVWIPQF